MISIKNTKDKILELKNITKVFPGVKAVDDVSFEVNAGEVHALVGENGAGKSTLMKVMAGIHIPEKGNIIYNGEKVKFKNPLDAKKKGIILIHQELSLVPKMTVAENILLGSLPNKKGGRIDWKELHKKAEEAIEKLGCQFKPKDLVEDLTIAHQQMVEIARAISYDAKVVIFDEPTASLTQEEVEVLYKNIELLKEQGLGIIYISHKLNEIFEVSDKITVLRDGKLVDTLDTDKTDEPEITKKMIGRDIEDFFDSKKITEYGEEVIRVENLSRKDEFQNINFNIKKGEVLGLYGLLGAGRTEIAETIFGINKPDSGKIYFKGQEANINNSKKAVKLGIGLVPESRKEQGLVLGMSTLDNISLAKIPYAHNYGFIKNAEVKAIFNKYRDRLSISTTGPKQKVMNLSGGNQQKIVIGKWLCLNPDLIILDEPTRGIDVGSKAEIHNLIAELAETGMAVLVISSEIPEILAVSHRIITMHQGDQTDVFTDEEVTEEKLIKSITSHAKTEEMCKV
ncbi:sugar ABC transporter ATP-binding protein [Halanaerobium hydrogeniformans]|uniref:ABC transporter related protein n=1 Tax=Halanaerobium hydrogeniformans TaxID=656519 RepID=E4RNW9_HALHG|nr:sugar ABC transporter ATP-binding protein [Halanaerobium hydrogeniformans]ADQ13659.1 ABC transporter related protein [Halanaerobium hydrogeniformans]